MKTALIISGGEYSSLPENLKYDICIACDKGLSYAREYGIVPDVAIGDFDSLDCPGINNRDTLLNSASLNTAASKVLTYPIEKDDTDTMLAVKYAIEQGFDNVIIICALGKRLDHTIANVQTLAYATTHGVNAEIISDTERISILTTSVLLPKISDTSLSLFALSDQVEGLTIKGAKYEVEDVVLTNSFPLGVSNTWKEDSVKISIKKGLLLIVQSSLKHESI